VCSLTSIQRNTVRDVKKQFFGDKDIEAVRQRLDRLTQDEGRIVAAQTLKVVYGLVQNMNLVVGGEQTYLALIST
jgi:hypothetical protein